MAGLGTKFGTGVGGMTVKLVLHSESCSGCLVTQQDPELIAHRSGASHRLRRAVSAALTATAQFPWLTQDMQVSSSLVVDPNTPPQLPIKLTRQYWLEVY